MQALSHLSRFGPFVVDRRAFELRRKGQQVRISTSLLKLLVLFIDHPGQLITRDQIAACLWDQPQYVDVTNGINTAVNRLRAILGDAPAKPTYLETVVGAGYRFKMPVENIFEPERMPQEKLPAKPEFSDLGLGALETPVIPSAGAILLDPPQVLPAKAAASTNVPILEKAAPPALQATGFYRRRRIIVFMAAIALAGCLGIGLGVAMYRRQQAAPSVRQSSAPVAFTEATFNDQDNPVMTQAVSHAGRWLAYKDRRGLFARELHTSLVKSLSLPNNFEADRLAWLSDDTALLVSGFFTNGNGAHEPLVWLVSLAGSSPRLLVRGASNAVASPDGQHLAYIAGQGSEVWLSGLAAESPRILFRAGKLEALSALQWSSASDRLIVEDCQPLPLGDQSLDLHGHPRRQCNYKSLDASTGNTLASESNVQFNSAFLLSDGRVYFTRDLMREEQTRAGLFMVKSDPRTGRFLSAPQLVSTLPGDKVFEVSASDDAQVISVLLQRRSSDVFVGDLALPRPGLTDVRRLLHVAPDNYPHSWTPDSQRVIFESNDSGDYVIYTQKIDLSPAEPLARSQQNAVLPQLSPDHNWVFFANVVWNPAPFADGLFRVPLQGGEIQQLPLRGPVYDFACPLTKTVEDRVDCIVRERVGEKLAFFRFDSLHGEGPQLVTMPWSAAREGDWSISSDGSIVAIPNQDSIQPEIRLIHLAESGRPSSLIRVHLPEGGTLFSSTWAAGDEGFYSEVKTGVGYDLVFVALDGTTTLLRQTYVPTWGVPSPDGKKLAFVDQTSNTNAWVGNIVGRETAVNPDEQ
jgi:DNA-binding winged helix-turn-helix (wHTH) protein